jgi:hypothetical protein
MPTEQKLIREARFGPPKCWKTGSVVSSYPKPLLVLQCDLNGIDIITPQPPHIPLTEFDAWTKKERKALPLISYVDFNENYKPGMTLEMEVQKNSDSFPQIVRTVNALSRNCPWRTVVLDSTTSMQGFIYGYLASTAPQQLADARKWAASIGKKIDEVITVLSNLKDTHIVVIMHEDVETNEITKQSSFTPMLYSKLRLYVGGILSQLFYQKMDQGKPTIWTGDDGFIRGVGARWPDLRERKKITPPTCQEIYGQDIA